MNVFELINILVLISFLKVSNSQVNSVIEIFAQHAKDMAAKHHDPLRGDKMSAIFSQASGVYKNKTKSFNPRLRKTVMINVVEGSGHRWNSNNQDKYKQLLQNHLCYSAMYGLEPIVFLADDNSTRFESEAKELQRINPHAKVAQYPHELFWSLVAQKTTKLHASSLAADYKGDTPSFKHFGFLVRSEPRCKCVLLTLKTSFSGDARANAGGSRGR